MGTIHVWQKYEIVLTSENEHVNPYKDVVVGVTLRGPAFDKKVYGFWDGAHTFKVRITATRPGTWHWESFSNVDDAGLSSKTGSLEAIEWSDVEKEENPCRRGFPRPSKSAHAFEYPDGTPFFWLADMWLAAATQYYPWRDDETQYPLGPNAGFKDMLQIRSKQGFTGITLIASFPAWSHDRLPAWADTNDGVVLRRSWLEDGHNISLDSFKAPGKDMKNEGGRPFEFPGPVPGYEDIVPDMTRINPKYFQYLDKRMDFCNEHGIIPFLELWRRDFSEVWSTHCGWPETYIKYIAYIYARYHANNTFFSPIHLDTPTASIPPRDYNGPIRRYLAEYGAPPFGTMVSTNANPSTLVNYGNVEWIDFHQIGNEWREHVNYWYLKEQYANKPRKPALNGEPYTPGFPSDTDIDMYSDTAALYARSGMYGSVLSGGQAGYVHELQALYDGCRSDKAKYRVWEVFDLQTSNQAVYMKTFLTSIGPRYTELIPESECIIPNKSGPEMGWTGWTYCAFTPDKEIFLVYFEKETPRVGNLFRGGKYGGRYRLEWFNPREGQWLDEKHYIDLDVRGIGALPPLPDAQDWALRITLD